MHHQLITSWNAVVKGIRPCLSSRDLAMHPKYEKGSAEILSFSQRTEWHDPLYQRGIMTVGPFQLFGTT